MARSPQQQIAHLEKQLAAATAAKDAKEREERRVQKQLRDAHARQRHALHVAIGELADARGIADCGLDDLGTVFSALYALAQDPVAWDAWLRPLQEQGEAAWIASQMETVESHT